MSWWFFLKQRVISTTQFLLILIVSYVSIFFIYGMLPKPIPAKFLSMSHEPRDVHIFQQHWIPSLDFHYFWYPISKLVDLSPGIGNYLRNILWELGELYPIFFDWHGTLPQIHKLLISCVPKLTWEEPVYNISIKHSQVIGVASLPLFYFH